MSSASDMFDIAFIGHVCFDEAPTRGRGDTTFAAYLARRIDHNAAEALKFAVALASIKMETPGPFNGTLDDVLARMR